MDIPLDQLVEMAKSVITYFDRTVFDIQCSQGQRYFLTKTSKYSHNCNYLIINHLPPTLDEYKNRILYIVIFDDKSGNISLYKEFDSHPVDNHTVLSHKFASENSIIINDLLSFIEDFFNIELIEFFI